MREPAVAKGRLPLCLSRCPGFSIDPWLFITTQSSGDADVTSRLLKSALCWCPFLPAFPSASISLCYEFQMLLFNVALEEKEGRRSLIMCSSGGLGKGVGGGEC